jgi:hypothetical protein
MESVTVYNQAPKLTDCVDILSLTIVRKKIQFIGETSSFVFGMHNLSSACKKLASERKVLVRGLKNLWKTHLYNKEIYIVSLGHLHRREFMSMRKSMLSR